MKPTYDAYSKTFLAFKAATLPFFIAIIKTWSACFPRGYEEQLVGLCIALAILFWDVAAIYIAKKLNAHEIKAKLKDLAEDITKLKECLEENPNATNKKSIEKKIENLQKQKIDLIGG